MKKKEDTMRKLIIISIICLLTVSCASYQRLLDDIPEASFDQFKYERGVPFSTATIIAEGAKKTKEGISIKKIYIKESVGGWTISSELLNYQRKFKNP